MDSVGIQELGQYAGVDIPLPTWLLEEELKEMSRLHHHPSSSSVGPDTHHGVPAGGHSEQDDEDGGGPLGGSFVHDVLHRFAHCEEPPPLGARYMFSFHQDQDSVSSEDHAVPQFLGALGPQHSYATLRGNSDAGDGLSVSSSVGDRDSLSVQSLGQQSPSRSRNRLKEGRMEVATEVDEDDLEHRRSSPAPFSPTSLGL